MSITDKMRQLNPRVESKVAPIDKIQSYLSEASLRAEECEKVISVAYNMKGGM